MSFMTGAVPAEKGEDNGLNEVSDVMSKGVSETMPDLARLMAILPKRFHQTIMAHPDYSNVIEIVMDMGRPLSVRFGLGRTEYWDLLESDTSQENVPAQAVSQESKSQDMLGQGMLGQGMLGNVPMAPAPGAKVAKPNVFEVTRADLDEVVSQLGAFHDGNRAGLNRTLHRISCVRNRQGEIVGLTLRVGRFVHGASDIVKDVLDSQKSVLILGAPGQGKTTLIRDAARYLADDAGKRVMVVDSSNEIGGEGDIPHPAIGHARRMQVKQPQFQYKTMVEAVQNHMPQVIVVDEIGLKEDAAAARTIAERGVQLIATAHAFCLENVIRNPVLSDLVGGVQTVILGDDEAKARGTQKVILERKNLPSFDVVVEMRSRYEVAIYFDVKDAVDQYLRDGTFQPEIRQRRREGADADSDVEVDSDSGQRPAKGSDFGHVVVQKESDYFDLKSTASVAFSQEDFVRVYPFGISLDLVRSVGEALDVPIEVVSSPSESDLIVAYLSQPRQKDKLAKMTRGRSLPIHYLRTGTYDAVMRFFKVYFKLWSGDEDALDEGLLEVKQSVKTVLDSFKSMDLAPRSESVMAQQLEYVVQNGLTGVIVGESPNRRVRIYAPNRSQR